MQSADVESDLDEAYRPAQKLMHSRGLSGVTTRQISQEVGCSEGALYVHFKGRLELLLAMLEESLPDMLGPLRLLKESVGQGSAQANLAAALTGIFKFHRRVAPKAGSLSAEPELLVAYRESLSRQGKGPHLSMAGERIDPRQRVATATGLPGSRPPFGSPSEPTETDPNGELVTKLAEVSGTGEPPAAACQSSG